MKILYILTFLLTLSSHVSANGLDPNCPISDPTCSAPPPTTVPEPGTLMLMGVGLLAGFGFMRKK